VLSTAVFTKGKNEIYPIPQIQIDLSKVGNTPVLKQNPNY
jgi:starch-binding outer membrane protein, SusD/RagB family